MAGTLVGDAVVRLVGDPKALLAEAEASGNLAGTTAGKGFTAGFAAVAAGAGIVAAIFAITEKTTAWANSVYLLQQRTGLSAETITAWQAAAQKMGVDGDAVATMLTRMAVNAAKVGATNPFTKIGIDVRDASGALLPMDTILNDTADKFAALPDGVQKSADAVALFGRTGAQLIPFLNQGSAGLADMQKEADKLGVTLSDQNVQQFHKLALAQEELDQGFKGMEVTLSEAFVPVLAGLVDLLDKDVLPAISGVTDFLANNKFVITDIGLAIGALTTYFVGLKVAAILGWVSTLGPVGAAIAATGSLAVAVQFLTQKNDANNASQTANAKSAAELTAEQANLDAQYKAGTISQMDYDIATDKLKNTLVATTSATGDSTTATAAQTTATGDLTGATGDLTGATNTQTTATKTLTDAANLLGSTTLGDLVTAMGNAQTGAGALGGSMGNLQTGVEATGTAVANLDYGLQSLPREITIDVVTRFFQTGAGAGTAGSFTNDTLAGNQDNSPTNLGPSTANFNLNPYIAPRVSRSGGGSSGATAAAHAATQAIHDQATALKTVLASAYGDLKRASDTALDSIHQKNLTAISDTLKLAQTNHTAALATIADHLRVALETDAAPVTAAEQALAATQAAEQLRNLQEALTAAQAGGDPIQIRNAAEALRDYQSQVNIDKLKAIQAAADAQAQLTAANDTKAADAALKVAQDKATADTTAENKRAAAVKAAFDAHMTTAENDAKTAGGKITSELAAAMIDGIPAVEKAAKAVAAAITKYLAVHSPAEVGPLHDNPPEDMGKNVVHLWAGGIITQTVTDGPAITASAAIAVAALGPHVAAISGKSANPLAGAPVDPSVAAIASASPSYMQAGAIDYAADPSGRTLYGPISMNPNWHPDGGYASGPGGQSRSVADINSDTGRGTSVTVNVHNPKPEPASTSTKRELQLLAATGVLG